MAWFFLGAFLPERASSERWDDIKTSLTDSAWKAAVRRQASILLERDQPPGVLRSAVISLFDLLSRPIGLNDGNPEAPDLEESQLTTGKAISPQNAARCVRDLARTSKFLRGTRDAIAAAVRAAPGETVRVLYAGCGPFAALVLPIAHEWAPGEVAFTLLDYHQRSLDASQHLAARLDVLDRIADFVRVDASTYQCPRDARPHVLVTETMQRALAIEPQVAITRHLAPQLVPGGLLVPERITLHATLVHPGKEFAVDSAPLERERVELGAVLTLDVGGIRLGSIVWPDDVPEHLDLFIRTNIRVWGDIVLADYESGLTGLMPMSLDRQPEPGEELYFDYEFEPHPRIVGTYARPVSTPA